MYNRRSMSSPEKHSFQAEIAQLLEIVIHSLYTDKEIFLRELVSNAADASEKLKFLQQTAANEIHDPERALEIKVAFDKDAKTVTVTDSGIGMTHEELVKNLGTIAHSGSRQFLEQIKKQQAAGDTRLIGQFGVGFYSAFMVADRVEVATRSYRQAEKGWTWSSDGKTGFEISETEDLPRGTRITLHLKESETDYASEWRLRTILKKYSNFVPFPIQLGDEVVNSMQPLWTRSASGITAEEYTEFYKYLTHDNAEPQFRLHFNADAPIAIRAVLFVPAKSQERISMTRSEPAVDLYCKQVLITPGAKELLPEWLRFLKGVVDSEDIPLNISRETMQDSALMRKIKEVLTGKVIRWLEDEAKADADKYAAFYSEHGHCLKEGAATDYANKEKLAKLLRFKSSHVDASKYTSLTDYVSRMPEGQSEIYYLSAPNKETALASPYYEVFESKSWEVLFLEDPRDEYVLDMVREFDGKKLVAAEKADVAVDDTKKKGGGLSEDDAKAVAGYLKETLGEKVGEVRSSQRLIGSPAAVKEAAGAIPASMRRMLKAMGQDEGKENDAPDLEINPDHPIIVRLNAIRGENADLASQIASQVFDNAMVGAGLMEDPRTMLTRLNALLETLLTK